MFTEIKIHDFSGIPYLQTSDLVKNHAGKIKLSTKKPNIIVGPNGSGKSAFLTTLSIKTLSYFTGQSELDSGFTKGMPEEEAWWTKERQWYNEWTFLKGLDTKGDGAPAMYYRPDHIPGNEDNIATAMMTGYFDLAQQYGKLVDNKSSGQQCSALLKRFTDILDGTQSIGSEFLGLKEWPKATVQENKEAGYARNLMPWDYKAAILREIAEFAVASPGIPALMMDEPEQSLDAKAEIQLWKAIEKADCTKMQIIVATHSMYPFMNPKKFNLIESVPGYIEEVKSLL